ncbi:MAG: hypothetical protein VX733_04210, partial [Candidatus Latescibacterota bacterium]|nr:hypothetical protein [Candidatus Latescibacterota bacterium]
HTKRCSQIAAKGGLPGSGRFWRGSTTIPFRPHGNTTWKSVAEMPPLVIIRDLTTPRTHAEAHMQITGVRTQPYQFSMQRPIGDANNPKGHDQMSGLAVWIDTDEGISGISMGGECATCACHCRQPVDR